MIELVDVMGDDLAVANAARVSFDKWKEEFEGSDEKLINYLAKHEHTSPFRHPQVSIRCKAPVFLARQLGKHQVGLSWNEVSRRYVDDRPEFYEPAIRRAKPEGSIKQGSGSEEVASMESPYTFNKNVSVDTVYSTLLGDCIAVYDEMLEAGVAPEMARMVLPQSMLTSWVWTGSLLAFFHVYRLRSDGHAQVEAQEFAKELDDIMKEQFPVAWEALKNAA